MKLLRLYAAIALLRGAGIMAGVIAGPDLTGEKPRLHPIERLLLGSIVGMGICAVWIAMTWRVWR